ncbi:hypothetical protein chiPu_0021066 [Chiloscyllium punctatum]|uniref:Uncharacterized protein n=1 Tax=Chiloscyllium punctatum TaxID=137246 RepID=A0A401RMN7_CHIPU|nr:hypothetical protein [Chiloscyllium punctatum]
MGLTDQSIITQPWSLIALRLGIEQDLEMEQKLFQKLMEAAVKKIETGDHFPMDLMAFYVLALRSWCQTAVQITTAAGGKEMSDTVTKTNRLVSSSDRKSFNAINEVDSQRGERRRHYWELGQYRTSHAGSERKHKCVHFPCLQLQPNSAKNVRPLTTANSNIRSFTTPNGAQDPVMTNSKVLNEHIQPLPNATLSRFVSPSTFHSRPTEISPSLAPTLLIAPTGQIPHILSPSITSAPYPVTASPINQNPLDLKSGQESFVVDETFPLVMTEVWSTVPGERAEMVSNENGEVGASDTGTTTLHKTATIIPGESLDTWSTWDVPLMRGKVAPIVGTKAPQIVSNQTSLLLTIVTGKPRNKTVPVLTTLLAREANEKTVLLEYKVGGSPVTEDTTPIPENGTPSVITRDTPSLTRTETGFNVSRGPTVNESVTVTMGRSNKTAV